MPQTRTVLTQGDATDLAIHHRQLASLSAELSDRLTDSTNPDSTERYTRWQDTLEAALLWLDQLRQGPATDRE